MKSVFIANLGNASASGRQRMWALEQCGVEVYPIRMEDYRPALGNAAASSARILRRPRLACDANRLSRDILSVCSDVRPELIWFEWPRVFRPSLFSQLRSIDPRPFLISFQDDNPWGDRSGSRWLWREYLRVVPEFDLHLAKRRTDVENLKRLGASACRMWMHGVYDPLFHPPASPVEKRFPISFVGTCMDDRKDLIQFLLGEGLPVHVFGTRWNRRSDLPRQFPGNFHAAVAAEEYAHVIHASQICLGLVSRSNVDEWTMRSFEVPGCAGLLLAERTASHSAMFREGKESFFFSTKQEAADTIRRLLPDDGLCHTVGLAAHKKCVDQGWTMQERMRCLLDSIPSVTSVVSG